MAASPLSFEKTPMPDLLYSSLKQRREQLKVVVGLAGFDSEHQLLVVRRAATGITLPDQWEIPGGHVEDADESFLAAMKREPFEETGLKIHHVIDMLGPFVYVMTKKTGERVTHVPSIQLNAAVVTTDRTVVLNQAEHSSSRWISLDDLATHSMTMTDGMTRVVRDAL